MQPVEERAEARRAAELNDRPAEREWVDSVEHRTHRARLPIRRQHTCRGETNTDRQRTHEESRGRPKWSLAKYLQGPGRTPPQERDSEHEYDSCRCPRGSCCTMVCIAHGTPLHPPSLSPATNQPNRRLLLFRSLRLAIGLGVGQKEVYGTDRRDRYR